MSLAAARAVVAQAVGTEVTAVAGTVAGRAVEDMTAVGSTAAAVEDMTAVAAAAAAVAAPPARRREAVPAMAASDSRRSGPAIVRQSPAVCGAHISCTS